ncbi:hypothetical protein Tco_0065973 [Tanacetum coccineum]
MREQSLLYHHPPLTLLLGLGLPSGLRLPYPVEVERLLVMTTPSPSPPISLSPPSVGERLARWQGHHEATTSTFSTPPVLSTHYNTIIWVVPTQIQTTQDSNHQTIIDAATAYSTARPTRGRGVDYGFVSTVDAEARRQGTSEAGYEVNTRVTELAELHEHDTHDLYALLEDAQDSRSRISQQDLYALLEDAQDSRSRISQRVDMDSQRVHETRFQMQQAEIAALRETDRRRQAQMVETLRVMRDMRREMGDMQTELLALRGQRRARQPAPDARIPDHQDASGDADSHV